MIQQYEELRKYEENSLLLYDKKTLMDKCYEELLHRCNHIQKVLTVQVKDSQHRDIAAKKL